MSDIRACEKPAVCQNFLTLATLLDVANGNMLSCVFNKLFANLSGLVIS